MPAKTLISLGPQEYLQVVVQALVLDPSHVNGLDWTVVHAPWQHLLPKLSNLSKNMTPFCPQEVATRDWILCEVPHMK